MSMPQFFHLFTDICLPIFVAIGLGWALDRRFRLHLESLVKLNIYAVMGQPADQIRAARLRHLGEHRPASTFVYVPQLVEAKYLIEIEGVAAR